jgi:uncharacterized glyoxalase superfamily protein PhnB
MFKTKHILLWSENPDELVKFYTDVLDLQIVDKTDIPATDKHEKDYGYDVKISDTNVLWIGHHDQVKGKNKDPLRIMFNLNVDSVQEWYERVEKAGCEIIQEPIEAPFSTKEDLFYVCTWLDPDGNCFQFAGKL